MKKLILLGFGLLFITTSNAQWGLKRIKGNGDVITKERNVGDYDRITVSGHINVELISGQEGQLTIEAEENFMEYILTEVKDGKLKIRIKKNYNLKPSRGEKIVITVPYEDISSVALSGSGNVISKDVIKSNSFSAYVSGSGGMNLDLNTSNIEGKVSGSGNLRLKGKTSDINFKVSGSGNIQAYELIADNADILASGSGNIRVFCEESIKARVSGSGNVLYKGNPDREDSKVSGSGNISKS
ncbi:DUF2807 domain-containing protein [Flavobacteriaceae bacterium R38]|nr:DUF2807 domain-containing protein [Flavobacteriaceae bacterium R38]